MIATRRNTFYLILLLGFFPICIIASAQKKLGLEPDKWAAILSKAELNEVNSLGSLTNLLIEADSLRALRFLDSLEASDNAKGYRFRSFFCMVKADFLYAKFAGYDKYKDRGSKELQPIKDQMMKLYAEAIDAAYHTEEDLMIGWVSFYSARRMRDFGETGWAVMYSKNGVDIFEKVGYDVEPTVYIELAELLYQVREYDESIIYAKKGISAWEKVKDEKDYQGAYRYKIRGFNTIALIHYEKNQHDSANAYDQQALQLATEKKDTLWIGKILGNIGKIMYAQNKFDSAYLLFKTDYQNSKADSIYDNAANASGWAARANLARGNKVAALAEAREAIRLLGQWPSGPYLRDTYYTLMQIFRAMGNYDSAFYYSDHYTTLNDSLEKEVVTSSLAISKAKLNDETSRYNIQTLNREERSQLMWRNIIIVGIVLLSTIGLLYLNRSRIKLRYKQEMADAEVLAAKERLQLFTENIIEKTSLVETLEKQVSERARTNEHQEIIATLSSQTILTEDDWEKFKTLYETIYPGFFSKLKTIIPDITVAEQRLAALIRLHLTTRQIASLLGISPNGVNKTRQRLRQRFNLPADVNVEEYIIKL